MLSLFRILPLQGAHFTLIDKFISDSSALTAGYRTEVYQSVTDVPKNRKGDLLYLAKIGYFSQE